MRYLHNQRGTVRGGGGGEGVRHPRLFLLLFDLFNDEISSQRYSQGSTFQAVVVVSGVCVVI